MGTKTYDNATDLITFSRASGGTALRKISYGSELVTNGTFDTDLTGWVDIGSGTNSVVSGQANLVTNAVNEGILQNNVLTVGKTYQVSYDLISITGGSVRVGLGSTSNGTARSTAGAYSEVLYVSGDANLRVYQASSYSTQTIVLDNITVKEVLFDQPAGTLTLFNHPNDIPRIEYDTAGVVKGLLIEEARTNLLTYSNDFTLWDKQRVTIDPNVTTSPDGNNTAHKLIRGIAGEQILYETGISNPSTFTFSVFAKSAEESSLELRCYETSVGVKGASFDLATQTSSTLIASDSHSIASVGNGWFKCSVTITVVNSISGRLDIRLTGTSAGDGTSGIYLYGAQLEAGSFPTSYISTSGATATRAADIASIPTSAFGYNQKQGSVYVDGTFRNGDTIVTLGSTTIAADADGVKDYTTTYSADPSATGMVLNRGTYRDVKYYPRTLTSAQLSELTT